MFLPSIAYLEGEYGLDGIYLGVPTVLGAGGIEKIIELELTEDEKAALSKSADSVKSRYESVGVNNIRVAEAARFFTIG